MKILIVLLPQLLSQLLYMRTLGSILIVDRDSNLAAILGHFLTANGYTVCFTTRVREGIKKLRNQKFTQIFLDPEVSPDPVGEMFEELMMAGSSNQNTPLTLMSSNSSYILPMKYVKRVNSIMSKPFALREFSYRLNLGIVKT